MRKNQSLLFLWGLIVILSVIAALAVRAWTHTTILRVAANDSHSGDSLRKAIPRLERAFQAEGKRVDIHVFSIPYNEFIDTLLKQDPKNTDNDPFVPLQHFDVVLVDDPWIAALASRHILSPLPHEWLGSESPLHDIISDYAPEFLRLGFYRDRAAPDDNRPRRPPFSQLDALRSATNEDYEFYALPYLGNMQTLAVSANIADAVATANKSPELTWPALRELTRQPKPQFYSRLGDDNGALIDFLPILWSYGGCLVGIKDGREVTGFQGESAAIAKNALSDAVTMSRKSSPEYSRFDEDLLFSYITSEDNLISISWLAFRGQPLPTRNKPAPRWYQMPVSTANPSGVCAENEERRADATGTKAESQRTGGIGLWSLAIEAAASDRELAEEFVSRAVLELDNDPPGGCNAAIPQLEPIAQETNPSYPSPLLSKMSCGVREMVSRARPRLSHPKWRDIEEAVGLRVREAHWQTTTANEAVCHAAQDVQRILDGGDFKCADANSDEPGAKSKPAAGKKINRATPVYGSGLRK